MSLSGYDLGPPSPDATRGAVNSESALTVPGSASPEGTYLASPQEADSPVPIDDLWDKVLDNYGLLRPTEVTEIHVFRVILQSTCRKGPKLSFVHRFCYKHRYALLCCISFRMSFSFVEHGGEN